MFTRLFFLFYVLLVWTRMDGQDRSVLIRLRNEFEKGRIKQPLESLTELQKTLPLGKSLPEEDKALTRFLIGQCYIELDEYDSALVYVESALEMFIENGNNPWNARAENAIGICLEGKRLYKLSALHYFRALEIFKSIKDRRGEGNTLNNIGLVYLSQKNMLQGQEKLNAALNIGKELKDTALMINALNNLGILSLENEYYEDAFKYFSELLRLDILSNDASSMAISYNNLGVVFTRKRNFTKALKYLHNSVVLKKKNSSKNSLANTYTNIAEVHLELEDLDSAQWYIQNALEILNTLNDPDKTEILQMSSRLFEKKGDYLQALIYFKKHIAHRDSSISLEQEREIRQAEKDYEIRSKDRILLYREKEIESKKLMMFITGIFLGLIVILLIYLYILYRNNRKHSKLLAEKIKENEKQTEQLIIINQEKEEARIKAENAAKIKSNFLSAMSHEIRTPLNSIVGISHLMKDDTHLENQSENIRLLATASENLLHLINDILDFNKLELGKFKLTRKIFSLDELLEKVSEINQLRAREKGLEFKISKDPSIPSHVIADEFRLNQVLINLLSNSVKFTEKGLVSLEVSVVGKTKQGIIARFKVTDTGIGIHPENQVNVFEAFTQEETNLNKKYTGTGLGLAISSRFIEQLNSKIELHSIPGVGSTFWFDVELEPIHTEPNEIPVNKTETGFDIEGKKILIVEDNPMNVLILKQFIHRWKGITHVAHNGEEALKYIENEIPDLILMDLHMPVMDGAEATVRIRKHPRREISELVIIGLTASSESDVAEQIYKAGMNDLLSKPFNPSTLLLKLTHFLRRSPHPPASGRHI